MKDTFSENIKTIIKSGFVEPILCLSIGTSNTVYQKKITSNPYDIQFPHTGEIFQASAELTGIDLPQSDSSIDKETYQIQFSDPNLENKYFFDLGVTGTPVVLYAVISNTLSETITEDGIDYEPGEFITRRPFVVYKGIINTATYSYEPSQGSLFILIDVVSELASLENIGPQRNLKDFAPTGSAIFDYVFENRGPSYLKWGKI